MRNETVSFAPGTTAAFAGPSGGFVVAALNAASAVLRGSATRRLRSCGIIRPRVCASAPRGGGGAAGKQLILATYYALPGVLSRFAVRTARAGTLTGAPNL